MKYFSTFIAVLILHIFLGTASAQKLVKFELLDKSIIDFEICEVGSKIVVCKEHIIESWDLTSKKKIFILENNSDFFNQCIDISANGEYIVVGTKSGNIMLWDLKSKSKVWEVKTDNLITDIKISPSNLSIAAGSSNSKIYKINFEDGKVIEEFNNHKKDITSLEFCCNGDYLLSSSADRSIIIWDYKKCKIKSQLFGHKDWIRDIDINKDETRMISCSDDGHLIFWNINNIENIIKLDYEKTGLAWLTSVCYFSDGVSYVYSDINGKIKFISPFIFLERNFKTLITKVDFVPNSVDKVEIVMLIKDEGIKIYGSENLKIKNLK